MTHSVASLRKAAAFAAFAAFAAASLTACGGGGGGGELTPAPGSSPSPSPSPAPAPAPSAGSSAACYNVADYNEGTVLVEEGITKMQGQPDIAFTRTTTTGARQDFAGARPVMFIPRSDAAVGDNREFRDLVNGNELAYGVVSDTSTQVLTQVYDPPVSTPLDMQPGQTVERNYTIQTTVVAKAGNGTVTTKDTVQERFTYTGMQTVQTAMGTFNVCKFNTDQVIVSPNAGTVQANFQLWTVSDGPYRGRTIKIASSSSNGAASTTEMTKITYTSK